MAGIVLLYSTGKGGLEFVAAFYETMEREWGGIDRLRLDKFYMLMTSFLAATFGMLSREHWKEELVEQFNEILVKYPLRTANYGSHGVCLAVLDHWVEELIRVGCTDPKVVAHLITPIEQLLCKSEARVVVERIASSVFGKLAEATDAQQQQQQEQIIVFDWSACAQRFFEFAKEPSLGQLNRNTLYTLRKKALDLGSGIVAPEQQKHQEVNKAEPRQKKHRVHKDSGADIVVQTAPIQEVTTTTATADIADGEEEEEEDLGGESFVRGDGKRVKATLAPTDSPVFVTGSGKPISISRKAKKRAKKQLMEGDASASAVPLVSTQQPSPVKAASSPRKRIPEKKVKKGVSFDFSKNSTLAYSLGSPPSQVGRRKPLFNSAKKFQ